jgi:hypothetical protein
VEKQVGTISQDFLMATTVDAKNGVRVNNERTFTMKRTHLSLLGIVIVAIVTLAVVMVAQHNVVQANDDGCNAFTIKGAYGFAIGGLASSSFSGNPQQIGEFVPLAAAGTFSFDGHGTTSRSFTLSYGGAIFPVSDSGPYTVNSDCTVSATYSDGTWKMVIIGHGKEIKAINASPGAVVQGILTRQERAD